MNTKTKKINTTICTTQITTQKRTFAKSKTFFIVFRGDLKYRHRPYS